MKKPELLTLSLSVVVVHCLLLSASAATYGTTTNQIQDDRTAFQKSLHTDCNKGFSTTCLKLDIASWVEKLETQDAYSILPGVSLVKENLTENTADVVAELAREFPRDSDARIDAFLMKKVTGFMKNHSLRINLGDAVEASVGEARKKKGDGGMGQLLAVAALFKGVLGALALGGLAALAGKALMTGLISLLLSAIIGLKSLAGGGGSKHTTYEVVAKPIYSHQNTHSEEHAHGGGGGGGYGHSSYGRSFDTLPLGLQPSYKPPQ